MTAALTPDAYGVLTDPVTLTMQRLLPGPIERVWAYLTDSDLRRQWLASGLMELKLQAPFELVWRNDELTDPPGERPEGFGEEHRMQCRILEVEPPRKLAFTWGVNSEVRFELEPVGDKVRLTIRHLRAPDRGVLLNVSAGWHTHLAILQAKLSGEKPQPLWDMWRSLRAEYDQRLPQ
jgi:uncharacterized protein YndB with AHSA1/START domain